ncbi:DUF47 domain-containing protein [Nesterenkonia alba]|uniref:DUF47 domain-containing protein n=1 Tax=Nesterenkonia alba TaxID=515814 RepID=UPI0003B536B7|nr:hypothetical protein [Nesterenkonia alba]
MIALNRQRHAQSADLLAGISEVLREGTGLLTELLGTPAGERAARRDELLSLEGQAMDKHFELMTQIRSVFLTPLPREDIFALSTHLNRTMEHIAATGDLMIVRKSLQLPAQSHDQFETLTRQVELTTQAMRRLEDFDHLEDYWAQIQRLTKQANRTHREWVTSSDSALQPTIAQQQAALAAEVLAAVHAQREVAGVCGAIIVRES